METIETKLILRFEWQEHKKAGNHNRWSEEDS